MTPTHPLPQRTQRNRMHRLLLHIASNGTGLEAPVLAPTPRPGNFQSALATMFGHELMNTSDTTALPYLAAMASSYEPSPDPAKIQAPDSQPTLPETPFLSSPPTNPTMPSFALIPYVPKSSAPELPMDLGNGKNTENTGLGDSQHAQGEKKDTGTRTPTGAPVTSQTAETTSWPSSSPRTGQAPNPPQISVRFSSPLAGIVGKKTSTIPDTYSEGATSQSRSTGTNSRSPPFLNLAQLREEDGATPENTGLSLKELNGRASKKDLIDFMAVLEESMEKEIEEMETRILQAIRAIPPPKTEPHGPEYQMQPPAQTQRRNPLPETTRTIPVPPQKNTHKSQPTEPQDRTGGETDLGGDICRWD